MTVIIDDGVVKCKMKGDVGAKDPSDLCLPQACVRIKQEMCMSGRIQSSLLTVKAKKRPTVTVLWLCS